MKRMNERNEAKSLPRKMQLLLLVLPALLTACGTSLPQPEPNYPKQPKKPPVTTPQPSVPYLENALKNTEQVQKDIQNWQDQLQATPLTQKH